MSVFVCARVLGNAALMRLIGTRKSFFGGHLQAHSALHREQDGSLDRTAHLHKTAILSTFWGVNNNKRTAASKAVRPNVSRGGGRLSYHSAVELFPVDELLAQGRVHLLKDHLDFGHCLARRFLLRVCHRRPDPHTRTCQLTTHRYNKGPGAPKHASGLSYEPP